MTPQERLYKIQDQITDLRLEIQRLRQQKSVDLKRIAAIEKEIERLQR